ncbi:MAG: redoxin domain-containing protein [Archangiaceae bacterium]|nr:redoxin domain-containing protein [Archangiaceae bacterium]
MSLTPGSLAPSFDLRGIDGKTVRLSESKGRYTLVSFNRFAACPLCNLAVREFSRKAPELAARNLRIISFFESSEENLKKALETWGPLTFELVADPLAAVYSQYDVPTSAWGFTKAMVRVGAFVESFKVGLPKGVGQDGSKTRMPAAFFLGPDLRVIEAYVGTDAGDHVPVATVERWLQQVAAPSPAAHHARASVG